MKSILWFLILILGALAPAHASSITTDSQSYTAASSQAPSVLNLYCQASSKQFYQSKLVLLESGSKDYDFALTTAHGIQRGEYSGFESCFIRDSQGQRRNVLDAYIAKGYKAGGPSDWAVLKLAKIRQSVNRRYEFTIVGEHAPEGHETIPISFPKARGINYNTQLCQALPSEAVAVKNAQILAHNCRVLKGQSGSPIVTRSKDKDLLIGIHLGKAWVFRSPITQKPEHMGYFRLIDEDMIKEINSAVRSFIQ